MFPFSTRQLSLNLFMRPKPSPVASLGSPENIAAEIPSGPDAELLHQKRVSSYISMMLGESVEVVFTNNRATMISFKKKSGVLRLRLHHMFQGAEEPILKALSVFVSGVPSKRASRLLDDFIREHRDEIKAVSPVRRKMREEGDTVHLGDVLARVAQRYFAEEIGDVRIGWGRSRARRKRRTRTVSRALATYNFNDQSIRVNPVLDSPRVPAFFLDWVVYHELLHHVLPVEGGEKRARYHTTRFRALEQGFEHYEAAREWEKENLEWLVR